MKMNTIKIGGIVVFLLIFLIPISSSMVYPSITPSTTIINILELNNKNIKLSDIDKDHIIIVKNIDDVKHEYDLYLTSAYKGSHLKSGYEWLPSDFYKYITFSKSNFTLDPNEEIKIDIFIYTAKNDELYSKHYEGYIYLLQKNFDKSDNIQAGVYTKIFIDYADKPYVDPPNFPFDLLILIISIISTIIIGLFCVHRKRKYDSK